MTWLTLWPRRVGTWLVDATRVGIGFKRQFPLPSWQMDSGIHLISGLPRSGSTLRTGILRQNARFHAGMTSPVGAMYVALDSAMMRRNETAVFIDDAQRRAVQKGLFSGYYGGCHATRGVRNQPRVVHKAGRPGAVVSSRTLHLLCAQYRLDHGFDRASGPPQHCRTAGHIRIRAMRHKFIHWVNRLAACDGLVGYALDALREAYFSEQVSRLILVEYRALMRALDDTMRLLYAMLEEPLFEHDFDNVEYQVDDFDMALSARGLRSVRRKVGWLERQSVLPPGLFERFSNDMFWRLPEANPVWWIIPGDLKIDTPTAPIVMVGEGPPSTALLFAPRKAVDADLRRHDDDE